MVSLIGEGRTATPALDLRIPSPVEELVDDLLTRRAIHLYLKRDDLIHPELPGNKWRRSPDHRRRQAALTTGDNTEATAAKITL
jgi:hypothetical protein